MKHDISAHGSPWKEQLYTPAAPSGTQQLAVWLDNMVAAGDLTWKQAHNILTAHQLRVQRTMIYRRLCSYIDKRIQQERTE